MINKKIMCAFAGVSILALMAGCAKEENVPSLSGNQSSSTAVSTQYTTSKPKSPQDANTPSKTSEIEKVAEYTMKISYGGKTKHFVIVKNNSDKNLFISASSSAYSDGNLVSVAEGMLDAIGPGQTSAIVEFFDASEPITGVETQIVSEEVKNYETYVKDMSCEKTVVSKGVICKVTNTSDKAHKFVKGYALFFKNGELVDNNYTYFTDSNYELQPGDAVTKQISCSEPFDSVEVYLDGRVIK